MNYGNIEVVSNVFDQVFNKSFAAFVKRKEILIKEGQVKQVLLSSRRINPEVVFLYPCLSGVIVSYNVVLWGIYCLISYFAYLLISCLLSFRIVSIASKWITYGKRCGHQYVDDFLCFWNFVLSGVRIFAFDLFRWRL